MMTIKELMDQIRRLEAELDAELARRAAELRYGMEQGRIAFEAEVIRRHKELKTGLLKFIAQANPLVVLTAPVIYSLIVPLVILDVFVSLYQAICFPVYKIAKVKRADYLVFDRHHLAYLNIIEKLNCAFCSYANGLFAYTSEIASLTEAYWCPIKHARRAQNAHHRYRDFADFGDAEAYRSKIAPPTDQSNAKIS
ncbi:MAG: hypothetical protein ACOYLL_05655 [Beijerinckiaceae bacterium]|jgi:hypothetical protein